MKIPKRFKLFGQTIEVKYDDDLLRNNGNYGEAVYHPQIIMLQTQDGEKLKDAQIEQTYVHEVVHHILYQMGEHELRNNEKFVDIFASLLHQANSTAEYE